MSTLTRGEALALIDSVATDLDQLYALARFWIGNDELIREDAPTATEAVDWLQGYVDCACDCDEARNRGPRDSDDSNLAPWEPAT